MSDGPLSVTVAPGSTAPVPSVALPKISPVLTCAATGPAASSARQAHTPIFRNTLLIHPPGGWRPHVLQNQLIVCYWERRVKALIPGIKTFVGNWPMDIQRFG